MRQSLGGLLWDCTILFLTGCAIFVLAGCSSVEQIAKLSADVAVASGNLTPEEAASLKKGIGATAKALEKLTPENEYYIGRSVAANLLGTYRPLPNDSLSHYVNVMGQTLATVSDKPETFGGYRFLVLDTDEINAFAAPGGLILVSRGLIRICRSEDALAAVLAHEIGHVELEHGLGAIRKSRWTDAAKILAVEAGKTLGSREVAELTGLFQGTIDDIVGTLKSGYGKQDEYDADIAAVRIMTRLGYNPAALREMLEELDRRSRPGDAGFGSTHPAASERIQRILPLTGSPDTVASPSVRQNRFENATAGI